MEAVKYKIIGHTYLCTGVRTVIPVVNVIIGSRFVCIKSLSQSLDQRSLVVCIFLVHYIRLHVNRLGCARGRESKMKETVRQELRNISRVMKSGGYDEQDM